MTVDKRINYQRGSIPDRNRGQVRSRPTPSAPKRTSPNMSGLDRQQYSAMQTQTGAVKGGGKPIGTDKRGNTVFDTGFVSGDRGRDSRNEFIRNVQKTNPGYTGRPTRDLPTVREFFGGIINSLPGLNFLRNLNQKLRGTDEENETEMERRINLDEAKLLQARINAGEFGGLDTMLDEVALTTGSLPTNTGGITSLKTGTFEPNTFDDVTATGGGEFPTVMSPGVNYLSPSNFQTIQPFGTVLEDEFPSNRLPSFIEVQDTPQSKDDFFLNAVADAMTFPTDDGSGISLMNRSILRNAGYNDSQIKEAQDAGYLDQLIRDIEGPIGGSLGSSAFG